MFRNFIYFFLSSKEDLPCDLCEQLVGHLRDLLVANTTEDEFKKVLEGLCKQTNSFKDECLSIVEEYYPVIYTFLVSELNSTSVCIFAGICPQQGLEVNMVGRLYSITKYININRYSVIFCYYCNAGMPKRIGVI